MDPASHLFDSLCTRLLDTDPDSRDRLAALEGRVVCIDVLGAPGPVYLRGDGERMRISRFCDTPADVTLRGTPQAFAQLAAADADSGPSTAGAVRIEGDLEVARRFQRMVKKLDIDWEEIVSDYVGDIAARQLGRAARSLRDWSKSTSATLADDVREFLVEKTHEVPSREEISAFTDALDALRTDVETMAARILRFQGSGR